MHKAYNSPAINTLETEESPTGQSVNVSPSYGLPRLPTKWRIPNALDFRSFPRLTMFIFHHLWGTEI